MPFQSINNDNHYVSKTTLSAAPSPANLNPLKFHELYHVEPFFTAAFVKCEFYGSHFRMLCTKKRYCVFRLAIQSRYHLDESQKNTYKLLTKVISLWFFFCFFFNFLFVYLASQSSKQPKVLHGSCNLFNVSLIIFNISDTSRNKNISLIID